MVSLGLVYVDLGLVWGWFRFRVYGLGFGLGCWFRVSLGLVAGWLVLAVGVSGCRGASSAGVVGGGWGSRAGGVLGDPYHLGGEEHGNTVPFFFIYGIHVYINM